MKKRLFAHVMVLFIAIVGFNTISQQEAYAGQLHFVDSVEAYTAVRGNITTYDSPYGIAIGYVDQTDPVTIISVTTNDDWVRISYTLTGGGTKRGYCHASSFFPSRVNTYSTYVTRTSTVYRRMDMTESYGYVTNPEAFMVVGKSGSKLQIIYRTDSGLFKMGWIYTTYVSLVL